jgi:hypothetical protein
MGDLSPIKLEFRHGGMARCYPFCQRFSELGDGIAQMDVPKDRGRSKRAGASAADGVALRTIRHSESLAALRIGSLCLRSNGPAEQPQGRKNVENLGQCRIPHALEQVIAAFGVAPCTSGWRHPNDPSARHLIDREGVLLQLF